MQANQETTVISAVFGEVIHRYTRAQAIEDGYLVDLMQDEMESVCRQHYRHPVACTIAVFEVMRKAVDNPRYCNSYAGILHDMLWMSRSGRKLNASTVLFTVIIAGAGRSRYHQFRLEISPGDQGEPVITISLPAED